MVLRFEVTVTRIEPQSHEKMEKRDKQEKLQQRENKNIGYHFFFNSMVYFVNTQTVNERREFSGFSNEIISNFKCMLTYNASGRVANQHALVRIGS